LIHIFWFQAKQTTYELTNLRKNRNNIKLNKFLRPSRCHKLNNIIVSIIYLCASVADGRGADAGRERAGAAHVRVPGGLLPPQVLRPLPLHGGGRGLALLAGLGRPPHQDLPARREQVLRDRRHRHDTPQQPRPGETLK